MRILICGGRNYEERDSVWRALDQHQENYGPMPSRSKARRQLKPINSFREVRSMIVISSQPLHRPDVRLDRMLTRSFATRSPK